MEDFSDIGAHDILNHCAQGIFVIDNDLHVRFWNYASSIHLLYKPEDIIGKFAPDLLSPNFTVSQRMALYKVFPTSNVKKVNVVPLCDQCGDIVLVDIYAVKKGTLGTIFYLTVPPCLPYEHILDIANIAVYSKDSTGKYKDVNPATERLYFLSRHEIVGFDDSHIMTIDSANMLKERDLEAVEEVTTNYDEVVLGNEKRLVLSTTRVNRGNLLYGISHDVTTLHDLWTKIGALEKERLQANEQMAIQSSKMKSEFLANMSHEIRTPINGIVGLNNLLKDTNLTTEQAEYVDGIHRSCGALMSIINDILDISKIEAGRIDLEYIDVNVLILLNDLYAVFVPATKNKGLELSFINKIPNDKQIIKADYGRLRQILNNLIGNAVKFTYKGSITVSADYCQERNSLRFDITDTGIGVQQDKLKTLFRPFTQAEASTTRRFGGTGLGLSISKSLVVLMHGQIGAISERDQGSTFWFEVPYIQGDEAVLEEHVSPLPPDNGNGEHNYIHHILIAEDNPMNQKVAVKTLEKLGHRVSVADNGVEAVNLLQMNPDRFDLILMDCQMPILDGYQATTQIRGLPDPINQVPIVAMTANALKGEKEHCLEVGMNDYITKPVNLDTLKDKIRLWARRRERKTSVSF